MSKQTPLVDAPLFRDPIFDGAADPTIIWNQQERNWWMLYTSRRANIMCPGVAWVHGTDIGVASSDELGRGWRYRGVLPGLEMEPGRNTFWAPEVFWHDGLYHLYVTYIRGVPHDWSGDRQIRHMTSPDLWRWQLESRLELASQRVIDACALHMADGSWRMWYKDEMRDSHTFAADSDDLFHWRVRGPVITDCPHEGVNVFFWRGRYWMITDPWNGLAVYRSADGEYWQRQPNILDRPGVRCDDADIGRHADVVVHEDRAYIFYFTHPDRLHEFGQPVQEPPKSQPYEYKRSVIQMAELELRDGILVCDRDKLLTCPR